MVSARVSMFTGTGKRTVWLSSAGELMFALKLCAHPKRPLSVTAVNFTVYPTKFCLPFPSGWGRFVGGSTGLLGCIWGYAKGMYVQDVCEG